MALPRDIPFIWVTWLRDVISGQQACHWASWFKAHNSYAKRPTDFSGWKAKHTRLLTEFRKSLALSGRPSRTELPIQHRLRDRCVIKGRVDCVSESGTEVIYYDCKAGQPADGDLIQVQLYMWLDRMEKLHPNKALRGCVVYEQNRKEVEEAAPEFAADIEYFLDLLLGPEDGALRSPGHECERCDIMAADCRDRDPRWP